jgi:hypothetical protein
MSYLRKTLLLLAVFSIAMGFLESSVVIYLRYLYYPEGFKFPLAGIPANVAVVEFLREAATIIMLLVIGVITGRNTTERFSFFLFCFAVWDIFYYIFLKLFLDWPESLFTWDILFVIPVPWVGPVIAPCLISLTMILLTVLVVYFHERDRQLTISRKEWLLFVAGSLVVIISFTWDYFDYIIGRGEIVIWTPMSEHGLFSEVSGYVPQTFNWLLFAIGEVLILTGIYRMVRRHRKFD